MEASSPLLPCELVSLIYAEAPADTFLRMTYSIPFLYRSYSCIHARNIAVWKRITTVPRYVENSAGKKWGVVTGATGTLSSSVCYWAGKILFDHYPKWDQSHWYARGGQFGLSCVRGVVMVSASDLSGRTCFRLNGDGSICVALLDNSEYDDCVARARIRGKTRSCTHDLYPSARRALVLQLVEGPGTPSMHMRDSLLSITPVVPRCATSVNHVTKQIEFPLWPPHIYFDTHTRMGRRIAIALSMRGDGLSPPCTSPTCLCRAAG